MGLSKLILLGKCQKGEDNLLETNQIFKLYASIRECKY